jgi:hypothetical protein
MTSTTEEVYMRAIQVAPILAATDLRLTAEDIDEIENEPSARATR